MPLVKGYPEFMLVFIRCHAALVAAGDRIRSACKTVLNTPLFFSYCMKKYFQKNMGTADRMVRVAAAIIFLALYFTETVTGFYGLLLLVLGIAFIGISIFSFCPFYPLLGINTCKRKLPAEKDN